MPQGQAVKRLAGSLGHEKVGIRQGTYPTKHGEVHGYHAEIPAARARIANRPMYPCPPAGTLHHPRMHARILVQGPDRGPPSPSPQLDQEPLSTARQWQPAPSMEIA